MRFDIDENQFEGEVIFNIIFLKKKECFFKQGISFLRDQFKKVLFQNKKRILFF